MDLNTILNDKKYLESERVDQIILLFERFCEVAQKEGYAVKPYTARSLVLLRSQTSEKLEEIHAQFLSYYNIVSSVLVSGNKMSDSRSLLWSLLLDMKLRPSSDLFDKINSEDVVEAYGADFRQIFRNLSFFDFCSYSLAEIFTHEWRDLFSRDPKINERLAELAMEVATGKRQGTVPIDVDWHVMNETFSEGRHKFNIRHKYLSPLYDKSNQVVAFIAVSEAELLADTFKDKEPRLTEKVYNHETQI